MDDADRNREVAASIREGLVAHGHTLINGQLDRFYVSQVQDRLLVLNHGGEDITRDLAMPDGSVCSVTLPGNSITSVPL